MRDGHQSIFATRMKTEDMIPLAEHMDEAGFWAVEVGHLAGIVSAAGISPMMADWRRIFAADLVGTALLPGLFCL